MFLTSLGNWSVAPLVLNGNEGRLKGMAVLESVHLCLHSEGVTALCTYPFVISWCFFLSTVSNVMRTMATAHQCLVGRLQATFWSEIPRLADTKLGCCHSAVSHIMYCRVKKIQVVLRKSLAVRNTPFPEHSSIEINATERSNWEKCNSLWFP